MSEFTIRRNRGTAVPRYQTAEKAEKPEKTAGSAPSRQVSRSTGFTVSETLRQLMNSQVEGRSRESRRTLQMGEAVLAEVQEKLDRIGELAKESADGENPDRAALQEELEQLRGEIDRLMSRAVAGGAQLFLDEETGDGADALLYAVLSDVSAMQEAAKVLPDWLTEAITQNAMTPEQILTALGLGKSAGSAELLAALAGRSPENDPAAGYLAALYLGAVIAGGGASGRLDAAAALEGLRQLLEKVAEGASPDQAVQMLSDGEFTSLADFQSQFADGSAQGLQTFLADLLLSGALLPDMPALPSLLLGLDGLQMDLMEALLTSLESAGISTGANPEANPEAAPEAASEAVPETASETAPGTNPEANPEAAPEVGAADGGKGAAVGDASAPAGRSAVQLGNVQAEGGDLSGVSLDAATGELVIGGQSDVVIRGMGQEAQAVRITGSGSVTFQSAQISTLTVDAAEARVFSAGTSVLAEVQLREGASLTLGGSGRLQIGAFHGSASNTLRLTGGAVELSGEKDGEPGALAVPVVLEGAASLAARAVSVRSPEGNSLEPLDLVWKALFPGWSAITAMEINGRQARMALPGGDHPSLARLWLEKGDPSHGSPIHALFIRGRDEAGRSKTRYAYLHWNQREGAFQEISMYPNPFTVTGGTADRDWVYEEESHTLRILSNQVTAVAGGAGTDANQEPFSGRIALEDDIGAITLALGGVVCQVSSGRAFSLGSGNDVTLILQSGTSNRFASGAGCAGISLGDGTTLRIDREDPRSGSGDSVGTLTASGGSGGAGIGRDSGGGRDKTSHILIRGGVITAEGTGGGAGIGAGKGGAMGTITIAGGVITSTASCHAAAIGAGVQGESGDILITGTARIRKALGGDPGADIGACLFGGCGKVLISGGADIGSARLWTRSGISLQMGEDTVTLPQFRLSSRALRLNRLRVSTRTDARAAGVMIDMDRRWVARIQAAYGALYSQLAQSGLYGGRPDGSPVRDTTEASLLLRDMGRSIPLPSCQAMQTHSRRGAEDAWQLLW
ncbi:MAG: hypothetical protein HDT14_06905 [Oscillibacter sp.]|nr:hypothetical protein [Oscillibacter sp.]